MTYPSNTSTPDYAELWQQELAELNNPNISASVKLETFFTQGVGILMGFYEQQMTNCANLMNSLSQLEDDTSEMQADFNQVQYYQEKYDSESDSDPERQADWDSMNAATADAMAKAQDISNIVNTNPAFASIAGDVNTQLSVIFPYGLDNNPNDINPETGNSYVQDTTICWYQTWSQTENPSQTTNTKAIDMGSITNAFDALNSDFSGLSSEFQSELQFYEGEDQQIQGLTEDCQQEWEKGLNTMQSNEISH